MSPMIFLSATVLLEMARSWNGSKNNHPAFDRRKGVGLKYRSGYVSKAEAYVRDLIKRKLSRKYFDDPDDGEWR